MEPVTLPEETQAADPSLGLGGKAPMDDTLAQLIKRGGVWGFVGLGFLLVIIGVVAWWPTSPAQPVGTLAPLPTQPPAGASSDSLGISLSELAARWNEAAAQGPEELAKKLEPHARNAGRWVLAQIGNVGLVSLQILLTVVLCAILYAKGETAAYGIIEFFRRIAGAHAESAVILAGRAIRVVAMGVLLTALIQSTLGGIGFAAALSVEPLHTLPRFVFVRFVQFVVPKIETTNRTNE